MVSRGGLFLRLGATVILVTAAACGGRTEQDRTSNETAPGSSGGSPSAGGRIANGTGATSVGRESGGTGTGGGAGGRIANDTGGTGTGATDIGSESGGTGTGATGHSGGCGPLIDDMESGTGRICTGEGRIGVWYAFNDGSGTQWPQPTDPGVPIAISVIDGGRDESTRAIHTFGEGFGTSWDISEIWGAGVGLDLSFDGTTYGLYNANDYVGIAFWARSDLSNTISVRISSEATTSTEYGGTCTFEVEHEETCNPNFVFVELTPEWTAQRIPFADFFPCDFERGKLTNIQFFGDQGSGAPFDFWIDDVQFVERPACCPSPLPGCEGATTYDDPGLEAGVRRATGKVSGEIRCEDLCVVESLCDRSADIEHLAGLECFAGFPHFASLDLNFNSIVELSPLRALTNLTSLNLWDNQISDATPIEGLTNLTSLTLSMNEISDLSPLAGLTSLTRLGLSNNRIDDLSPLAALTALEQVDLRSNAISDLGPLQELTNLTWLDITYNDVTDLTPLVLNPGLDSGDRLFIMDNPLDCETQAANLEQLEDRGVHINGYCHEL